LPSPKPGFAWGACAPPAPCCAGPALRPLVAAFRRFSGVKLGNAGNAGLALELGRHLPVTAGLLCELQPRDGGIEAGLSIEGCPASLEDEELLEESRALEPTKPAEGAAPPAETAPKGVGGFAVGPAGPAGRLRGSTKGESTFLGAAAGAAAAFGGAAAGGSGRCSSDLRSGGGGLYSRFGTAGCGWGTGAVSTPASLSCSRCSRRARLADTTMGRRRYPVSSQVKLSSCECHLSPFETLGRRLGLRLSFRSSVPDAVLMRGDSMD